MDISPAEKKSFLEGATWYHTIDFPGGQSSKGVFDHRKYVPLYKMPASLEGKEVLDVGSSDGFFSFEFERRGAKRVLAVDTNKFDGSPALTPSLSLTTSNSEKYRSRYEKNAKFQALAEKLGLPKVHLLLMAKEMLNSKVEYQDCSIYNLTSLNQKFDLVFCGDLIEHLKNPIEAIEQLSMITREQCIITSNSLIGTTKMSWWMKILKLSPFLSERVVTYWGDRGGSFFHFSPETFIKLLKASGFSRVEIVSNFGLKNFHTKLDIPHIVYHCWK